MHVNSDDFNNQKGNFFFKVLPFIIFHHILKKRICMTKLKRNQRVDCCGCSGLSNASVYFSFSKQCRILLFETSNVFYLSKFHVSVGF